MTLLPDLGIQKSADQALQTAHYDKLDDRELLDCVLEIYDQGTIAAALREVDNRWCRETLNRTIKGKAKLKISRAEARRLIAMLPKAPRHQGRAAFTFIDLFAGIGGIRRGFESIGGECVFTSEWDKYAVRTYKANHYCDPGHDKGGTAADRRVNGPVCRICTRS